MLHPASIAIVGASSRAGSFGERVLNNLAGYKGNVHLVNPKNDRLGDRPCHPNLSALPESPDCVVVCVPREGVEEVVLEAARVRAGGVILFASGYAETGKADRIAQQSRLSAIAAESGLRILGPNCLGIANYSLGTRITFSEYPAPRPLRTASVGIASQSGALSQSLAQSIECGLSVSHSFAAGNQSDVDVADLVAYLAEDDACRSIVCVFEGMAQPERLLAGRRTGVEERQAAARPQDRDGTARSRGRRVAHRVAGRVECGLPRGLRAGGRHPHRRLRGADGGRRLFRQGSASEGARCRGRRDIRRRRHHGGRQGRGARRADAAAVRRCNGCADAAHPGLWFRTQPLRRYGAGRQQSAVALRPAARRCCRTNNTARSSCRSRSRSTFHTPRIEALGKLSQQHGKITCNVMISQWLQGPGALEAEINPNVAQFRSMDRCFAVLAAWHRFHDRQQAGAREWRRTSEPSAATRGRGACSNRPRGQRSPSARPRQMLATYGVPVVEERLVQSEDEAVAAADAAGYPVVLKVESPDLPHKTEAGVVQPQPARCRRRASGLPGGHRECPARSRRHRGSPAYWCNR